MLRRIIAIGKKEFLHVLRDQRSLLIIILFPVFMLLLFGYAISLDVQHLPTAFLDLDRTNESRELISRFISSKYFNLSQNLSDERMAAKMLDSGQVKVFVKIPPDYSAQLKVQRKPQLQVIVDGSDPTVASVALGYISNIIADYSQELIQANLMKMGVNTAALKMPVRVETRVWYNPELRSLNFFVPGLLVIILMMLTATSTSLIIVNEKERGSIEQLIASPLSSLEIILGKVVPYIIISFLDVILVVAVAALVFKVPIHGSLFLLFSISLVFLLSTLGIGIFISTIARKNEEAMMLSSILIILPTIMLSGFIFPISSMPPAVQLFTYFIPARYFLSVVRSIFLKGVGLGFIWPDVAMLSLFMLVIIVGSALNFKKKMD